MGWYLPYGLSYRDVEQLLAGRGVDVDHVKVCRWVRLPAPSLRLAGCYEFIKVEQGRRTKIQPMGWLRSS